MCFMAHKSAMGLAGEGIDICFKKTQHTGRFTIIQQNLNKMLCTINQFFIFKLYLKCNLCGK